MRKLFSWCPEVIDNTLEVAAKCDYELDWTHMYLPKFPGLREGETSEQRFREECEKGLAIRYGGAMDGIEVVAVIFAKPLGLSVGTFVLIYNVLLYIICGIVMGSWILPLYSIVTYAAGSKTVDFIVDGLDSAKAAMIITTHPDEIARAVSEEFGTGLTIIDAHGFYSDTPKTVLYVVVNRFQTVKLKTLVKGVDANAYMAISPVADLLHGSKEEETA